MKKPILNSSATGFRKLSILFVCCLCSKRQGIHYDLCFISCLVSRGAELRIQAVSIEITSASLDFLVQECKYALIQHAHENERKRQLDALRYASPKPVPRRRTMDGSPISPTPTLLESTPSSAAGGFTPRREARVKAKVLKQSCYYVKGRRAFMARVTKADGSTRYKSFRVASPKSADAMKENARLAAMAWIRGMGGRAQ